MVFINFSLRSEFDKVVFISFRSLFGPRFERFPLKESHFRGPKIAKIFRLRRAQKSEFGKVVFINFSLRSEFDQGGFSLGGGLLLTIPRYVFGKGESTLYCVNVC